MFINVLYGIWFLLPLFFFTLALWAWLERLSKSPKRQNPKDFMRQGTFLLGSAVLALLINEYVLQEGAADLLPNWLPLTFVQIMLLPIILLLGAKMFGGTTPISIQRPGSKSHSQAKAAQKKRR